MKLKALAATVLVLVVSTSTAQNASPPLIDADEQSLIDQIVSDAIAKAALAQYKECTTRIAMSLDDAVSDANTIAKVAEGRCESKLAGITSGTPSEIHQELINKTKIALLPGIVETVLLNRVRLKAQKSTTETPRTPAPKIKPTT